MKRRLLFLLLIVGIIACSGKRVQDATAASEKPDKPTLKMTASPRQGFAPLNVTFQATLEGVAENDKEFYCLKEEWDFGDGSISTEQANCPPYTPESKVKREFFNSRLYEREGRYTVRLMLGDEKIRSKQITVAVVERSSDP